MEDEQLASDEFLIKEYPYSTQWLEEKQVIGVGNLILTNKRLAFLHRVTFTDEQAETLRKFSEGATANKLLNLALSLHRKNFQIPLSSLISAKIGLYSRLPFPRFCLRIAYQSRKKKVKSATFMFTIPLLRGFFQFEITTVFVWVQIINKAIKGNESQTPA